MVNSCKAVILISRLKELRTVALGTAGSYSPIILIWSILIWSILIAKFDRTRTSKSVCVSHMLLPPEESLRSW